MHLKNFSVIHTNQGVILAPAYDLLNVNLIFPEDDEEMALTLNGKKKKIAKKDFDQLAENLNLPVKAILNIYKKFAGKKEQIANLVQASFLPEEAKNRYVAIWNEKVSKIL